MVELEQRYFIREEGEPWRETDMAGFVRAERNAGFHNKQGHPDLPATSGFSGRRSYGRTIYVAHSSPELYAWDPEFCKVAWPAPAAA